MTIKFTNDPRLFQPLSDKDPNRPRGQNYADTHCSSDLGQSGRRWRRYGDDEIVARDKTGLESGWLKDKSLPIWIIYWNQRC